MVGSPFGDAPNTGSGIVDADSVVRVAAFLLLDCRVVFSHLLRQLCQGRFSAAQVDVSSNVNLHLHCIVFASDQRRV